MKAVIVSSQTLAKYNRMDADTTPDEPCTKPPRTALDGLTNCVMPSGG